VNIPLISKLPNMAQRWIAGGGIAAGGLGAVYFAKPYVLAEQHYFADATARKDGLTPELRDQIAAQRRQNFETMIFNQYIRQGAGKIDWYQAADIIDYVARNTPSDDAFRKDIWYLFGWRGKERSPLVPYLDPANRGLPKALHNTHEQSEQLHHYLGGTTGNMDKIPSHLLNNKPYAYYYEFKDFVKRGKYNWGDVRLFNAAQKHRDDFLKNGRFVVANNIRSLLEPKPVYNVPQTSWASVPSSV
jgi:hypothetical protein